MVVGPKAGVAAVAQAQAPVPAVEIAAAEAAVSVFKDGAADAVAVENHSLRFQDPDQADEIVVLPAGGDAPIIGLLESAGLAAVEPE